MSIEAVADPGEAPPPPPPPPFILEQTEAQRAEKIFLETGCPHLSKGLDDRAPPLSQGLDPALRSLLL